MDQFWAPEWAPKSVQAAVATHCDFLPEVSRRLLVPRSPQNASRWPRGGQDSPQLAQNGSQNSPKMGQVGPNLPKIAAKLLQESLKIGEDGHRCCFCFAFAFLLQPNEGASRSYHSLSFVEYNSSSSSFCRLLV